MPDKSHPRRGSLQFWPRKRAKRVLPRIRTFILSKEVGISIYPGYKAGMTHVQVQDKKDIKNKPVTIVECPPVKVVGIRVYKDGKVIDVKDKEKVEKEFREIRLMLKLQPRLIGLGKKERIFEAKVNGDKEKALEYALNIMGKEIKVSDVFKEGQNLDVHGITKGKGFQGTVKRYGVKIRQHKSEKTKRGIGTLGPWTPKRVSFRVPQAGKMGYHLRTEYNKYCMRISNDAKKINVKGGFLHYGNIKNDYVLLMGSISGSAKRVVILSKPLKGLKEVKFDIKGINLDSKQ